MKSIRAGLAIAFFVVGFSSASIAEEDHPGFLNEILGLEQVNTEDVEPKDDILGLRSKALQEQAFIIGAQSGLWWKGNQLQDAVRSVSSDMDSSWNFSRLMLNDGTIVPPVISKMEDHIEARNNVLQVVDVRYSIDQEARFSVSPLNWRNYMLYDQFEKPDPEDIPNILLPTEDERDTWKRHVLKGWRVGQKQAIEVMALNIHRLSRDFNGMIRYHVLLAMNMVSKPFIDSKFEAVTGTGNQMSIGNNTQVLKIKPRMNKSSTSWKAIPEVPSAFTAKDKNW